MKHEKTAALQKMDISHTDWELDRMFGSWNSAIQYISDWIQVDRNHKATMIPNKVYKVLLHCEFLPSLGL